MASFPCAASIAFNFAALSLAASVADKLALPATGLSVSADGISHLLFLLRIIENYFTIINMIMTCSNHTLCERKAMQGQYILISQRILYYKTDKAVML